MKGSRASADLLELARDVDLQLLGLDDTRTRDQKQRPVQSDLESAKNHGGQATSCAARYVPAVNRCNPAPLERAL